MDKLNANIELRKERDCCVGTIWVAYFRGTRNRVQRNGVNIPSSVKQSNVRFNIIANGYDK